MLGDDDFTAPSDDVRRLAPQLAQYLADSPADFEIDCKTNGLPAVTLVWQAVFPTAGFAQFRFGGSDGEIAAASLFLSRMHAASDEAIISSGEAMLGSQSRANLASAFATVRQHHRPVSANFALAGANTREKRCAILAANLALAQAFFSKYMRIERSEPADRAARLPEAVAQS